jgi:hypothetical protein
MKKLFLALMLVFFVSSFSFAQINKNWDGTKPEVYKGSKYLTFMYSPFQSPEFAGVNAGSYLGMNPANAPVVGDEVITHLAGVGVGMFVTSNISLGLAVDILNRSYEFTTTPIAPLTATQTTKNSETMIGFGVDADYHLPHLYSVSPYIGVNLNLGMYSGTQDITNNTGAAATKHEYSSTGIYGGFNLGFDWYFTPGLSLGGKYTLGFSSFGEPTYKDTQGSVSLESKGGKVSSIGTGMASIFLKVHF